MQKLSTAPFPMLSFQEDLVQCFSIFLTLYYQTKMDNCSRVVDYEVFYIDSKALWFF